MPRLRAAGKPSRVLKPLGKRTHLIVGLRFRGLRGPVDQPGTQRVRAGRRSPAWQVILDPECGKALALLRRAAGSTPARSTKHFFSWSYRCRQTNLTHSGLPYAQPTAN